MADQFIFSIVTPDGEFYNSSVEKVTIRTTEGVIGILYDHSPTTVTLGTGPIEIVKDGRKLVGVIHGGFAKIGEEKVILLPDAAEWPEEIDVERARRAKQRALEILESESLYDTDPEKVRKAEWDHARAITRLDVESWVDRE